MADVLQELNHNIFTSSWGCIIHADNNNMMGIFFDSPSDLHIDLPLIIQYCESEEWVIDIFVSNSNSSPLIPDTEILVGQYAVHENRTNADDHIL